MGKLLSANPSAHLSLSLSLSGSSLVHLVSSIGAGIIQNNPDSFILTQVHLRPVYLSPCGSGCDEKSAW